MVRTGGQGKEEIVECAGTLTRQEHSCSRLGPGLAVLRNWSQRAQSGKLWAQFPVLKDSEEASGRQSVPRQVKAHSLTLQNPCQKGHSYMLMVFIYNTFLWQLIKLLRV